MASARALSAEVSPAASPFSDHTNLVVHSFCFGVWLTRLPPTRFPPPAVVLLLRPVDTWQDLPYASGEGGAGERVKSASAFPGKPEQQKDYMSDLAVAESVAALGEFCRNVEIAGAYQQPQHKQRPCSGSIASTRHEQCGAHPRRQRSIRSQCLQRPRASSAQTALVRL